MLENSPYTWFREEDDQGNFTYSFCSDSNIVYTAYFNLQDHIEHIQDFPVLLQNGYEFGFYRRPDTSTVRDRRVIQTIHDIILDFLDNQPDNTIVLYFCQPSDDNTKQRQREMLFQRNYDSSPRQNEVVKKTLEVVVPVDDRTDPHYIGFFTLASNPDVQRAKDELDAFALKLANAHFEK